MSATISDPFLLSAYDLSKRFTHAGDSSRRRSGVSNVYVTHHQPAGSKEGYATVASHGDGVHLLDVSNLHLANSRTLGPSTSFSCPAVSRTVSEDGAQIRRTYAVIDSSPDVIPDESGRTVWMWRDDEAGESSARSRNKKSFVAPQKIHRIYAPSDVPSLSLLVSPSGDVTVADGDLNIPTSQAYSNSGASVRKSFVFSQPSCSFLSGGPSSRCAVVLFLSIGERLQLYVLTAGEDGFEIIFDDAIPLQDHDIADISCSPSGYISILSHAGTWTSFQFQRTGSSSTVRQLLSPLHLTQFSFIASPPSERTSDEISLLSLTSSHVLLAAISAKSPELVLLLWDIQYSVLLTSHTLPIPSTLSHPKEGIRIELIPASSTQALLVLSPKLLKASSASRSSVLVVPFTCPSTSTIANAMGRAGSGKKWLSTTAASPDKTPGLDSARGDLLKTMRTAVEQGRPEAADTAFFAWVEREKTALVKAAKRPAHPNAFDVSSDSSPELGHEFVRQLLDVVIQPSKGADASYSPKVIHYLLQRRVVSAKMIDGGLLSVFQSRKDEQSILLALQHVIDLSENDILALLHTAITSHRQQQKSDPDAMQVDTPPSNALEVSTVLSSCVNYPTSLAALRVAIRQHLRDAEDVTCVLEVLDGWLETWCTQSISLLPNTTDKNPREIPTPSTNGTKEACLPPLDKVLAFLRAVLDSSFLALLQYTPSHRLLQRLSARLDPELAFIDEVEQLRGPLEPFAKAQAKALAEGVQGARKDTQVDWRRRKKLQHEQTALAVGLYQVEELVI